MPYRLRRLFRSKKQQTHSIADQKNRTPLETSLKENLKEFKKRTGNSSDVVIRTLTTGGMQWEAAVVYIDGIVDNLSIDEFLLEPLLQLQVPASPVQQQDVPEFIAEQVIALGGIDPVSDWETLFEAVTIGRAVLFIDGAAKALSASTIGGERRAVEEPPTEISIRGPREGFTESIRTNTAMVRRRIKNPNLRVKTMKIGRQTKTNVEIMYLEGIADNKVVEEVRRRLKQIDMGSILDSGYIEELIEDQPSSPFPTIHFTERPDSAAGNILEGRVAVFVDGSPFILHMPAVFIQFFQSVDDYYSRSFIASSLRMLRIMVFLISLYAPATYVAATTFHQEMIPTQLLIVLSAQREAVPFPAVIEAFIMETTFEILREAGIRMPKAVGQTVSIVGALVIGQSAVQAGIVSPAMVIIVAITAIASFTTPSYSMAVAARMIRFILMVIAASFGFYGLILSFIVITAHLCGLRSFGVPYMAPLAPFIRADFEDSVIRLPWWEAKERPRLISGQNSVRQGENLKPEAPGTQSIRKQRKNTGELDED
ncbi:spore germination protein [Salibacterium halotolerans]|uniref:Spore germination protein KA n=1 Tax=Salibacterium halotolerans TaxID=1884432 RepID=A0A1I5W2B6_9BACI|nr:spore germination protein KA [Salibacterium halotolerans]